MSCPTLSSCWSFDDNARLYRSQTQEQRDAAIAQSQPELTGSFSTDYVVTCRALGIQLHPALIPHILPFQPVPKPQPPPASPSAASDPTASPPSAMSTLARPASPRPPTSPAGKKGEMKKKEEKKETAKGGKPAGKATTAALDKAGAEATAAQAAVEAQQDARVKDERDSLALTQCKVDVGTIAAIAVCLAVNCRITRLQLQHCVLSDAAARQLQQIASRSCVQLLQLEYILVLPAAFDAAASPKPASHPLLDVALTALASSSCVQLLSLQGVRLDDETGAAIASQLIDNRCLLALDLSNNRLSARTAAALASSLLSNTTLQRLSLALSPLSLPSLSSLLLTAFLPSPLPAASTVAQAKKAQPSLRFSSSSKRGNYRDCNSALTALDISWCEGGEGIIDVVRKVLEAGGGRAVSGDDEAGWSNGLKELRCGGNGEGEDGWQQLQAMAPLVKTDDNWQPRFLHAATGNETAATVLLEQQPAAAALVQ